MAHHMIIPFLALLLTCCSPSDAFERAQTDSFRDFAIAHGAVEWSGAIEAPGNVTWRTQIADEEEPGTRITVSGTIYLEDGVTPAPGFLLYVYHTDNEGRYSRGFGKWNGQLHGLLRGWMLTGDDGKYEFSTIRPAGYPDFTDPEHIHATLTGPNVPEHWIDVYHFADDPRLGNERRSDPEDPFGNVLNLKTENGVLKGVRDIRLLSEEERQRRSPR